jgi:hypothetical protein
MDDRSSSSSPRRRIGKTPPEGILGIVGQELDAAPVSQVLQHAYCDVSPGRPPSNRILGIVVRFGLRLFESLHERWDDERRRRWAWPGPVVRMAGIVRHVKELGE